MEENKLLFTKKFDNPRLVDFEESGESNDVHGHSAIFAGIKFTYKHDQDCCEQVYADFSYLKYYKEAMKEIGLISKIEIKGVKDIGFIIFLYNAKGYLSERLGILVACYNEQNGYYSDDLQLILHEGDEKLAEFDIDKESDID